MKINKQLKNNSIELLSPAGSWDSLLAAIQNGADAVYLGGKSYSARQNAENFDNETLLKAINYAHLRNVKVYLTMNTLISDAEMKDALKSAYAAYQKGIDAIIIQDIGFARVLKNELPDLDLHASTQMTVYDVAGVKELSGLGFSRIVLARELSLEEINNISKETRAELEVFIHGALCISYSGQCLFSSMIGGRSGNRGRCAQPCRLPYQLYEKGMNQNPIRYPKDMLNKYLLSPKDLSGLELLPDIIKSGVKSLKIEGRMKTPEYVAIVTGIYRKYIDMIENLGFGSIEAEYTIAKKSEQQETALSYREIISKEDMNTLAQIFNRGGFTKGYLNSEKGKTMMSYQKPKNWGLYLGEVLSYNNEKKLLRIALNNGLQIGDGIELMSEEEKAPGSVVSEIMINGKHIKEAFDGQIVDVGRLTGKIKRGDKVYRTSQKGLNENARKSFEDKENKIRLIQGEMFIKTGFVSRLVLRDRLCKVAVEVIGEKIPEAAIKQSLRKERVVEQLKKTGGTPFEFESIAVYIDDGITLPVGELNALRRKGFDLLTQKIVQKSNKALKDTNKIDVVRLENEQKISSTYFPGNKQSSTANEIKTELSVCFYKIPPDMVINELEADIIYLPFGIMRKLLDSSTNGNEIRNYIKNDIECARNLGKKVILRISPIVKGVYLKMLKDNIDLLYNTFDGLMLGGVNILNLLRDEIKYKNAPFLIAGDISLNVYNSSTLDFLGKQGVALQSLSAELSLEQIKNMKQLSESFKVKKECIIYGRVPVMTSEYCVKGALVDACKQCKTDKGNVISSFEKGYYLIDRLGLEFPLLTDELECRMTIFNSKYLFIEEVDRFIDSDIQVLRINIVDENKEEVNRILDYYNNSLAKFEYNFHKLGEITCFDDKCVSVNNNNLIDYLKKKGITKGHYYRGV